MYGFILDDFCWSFSRIECFDRCQYCFELQYIKKLKGTEGVYGQYGNLVHLILEKYAKNELMEFELSNEYKSNFDKVITDYFPYNKYVDLKEKYFNDGLTYFDNFEGFGDRKILAVESEYNFKIGDYNFTGKLDLECEDEIVDNKTKGKQHITRLTKKHDKNEYVTLTDGRYVPFETFIQLYIYCIPYYNKYKKYPKKLSLNMIRIQDWYEILFNINEFEKAKQWILNRIEEIYKTTEFKKGNDVGSYWCNNSCGMRFNCKYSDRYLGEY